MTTGLHSVMFIVTVPLTPINDAHRRGLFLSNYNKPSLNYDEQISLLKKRGLIINDEDQAKDSLKKIGYYRLNSYASFFCTDSQVFRKNICFENIKHLYECDRKLRLLILDAVERIEVAIKALLIDQLSVKYSDPHWYLNKTLFDERFKYEDFISHVRSEIKIDKPRKEKHIEGYVKKYSQPELPPVWVAFQSISFGTISRLYSSLRGEGKILVSQEFKLSHYVLSSWLQSIAFLRNLCAHHANIWSKKYIFKPKKISIYDIHFQNPDKLYTQIFIVYFLLKRISGGSKWIKALFKLLEEMRIYQDVMGFPKNWQQDKFWH